MTSLDSRARSAGAEIAQAGDNVWVARLARFGCAVRGVLYVLLAYLAVRVALGQPNRQADRQGALHTIAHEPFGRVVLVVVAGGFAAYTLWQFSVALQGGSARAGSDRPARRVLAFLTAILYAFFCFSAAAIAAGTSRAGAAGGDTQEVDRTAILMRHSFGRLVVGVAGAAVIAAGGVLCWKALSGRQETDLRPMARGPRRAVEALGVAGTTARAVTIAGVGVFVLEAAVDLNPRKARGLDGTLKSFAHTPVGPWLLVLVAVGLLAFGLYSFAEARYARL